jgi:hypothetical protein
MRKSVFDLLDDSAPIKPVQSPEVPRLSPEEVLDRWRSLTDFHRKYNDALNRWHRSQKSPKWIIERDCQLEAAATLGNELGEYTQEIIYPFITRSGGQ